MRLGIQQAVVDLDDHVVDVVDCGSIDDVGGLCQVPSEANFTSNTTSTLPSVRLKFFRQPICCPGGAQPPSLESEQEFNFSRN